jgi:hypothetical protein
MFKIALDLSESDLESLIEVLNSCISDLSFEIADTDSQDFRDKLKIKRTSLSKILLQLNKEEFTVHSRLSIQ